MRLEEYLGFLEPDVLRLRGHRIGLEHVIEAYKCSLCYWCAIAALQGGSSV
jgi:hypothetical protein